MTASLSLFYAALVFGAGFGITYTVVAWLVGKVLGAVDRSTA